MNPNPVYWYMTFVLCIFFLYLPIYVLYMYEAYGVVILCIGKQTRK